MLRELTHVVDNADQRSCSVDIVVANNQPRDASQSSYPAKRFGLIDGNNYVDSGCDEKHCGRLADRGIETDNEHEIVFFRVQLAGCEIGRWRGAR